jgi:hypothetical protein
MRIAIKGDKARFKEVNAILRYLSGKKVKHKGSVEELYYCIGWYKCVFCYSEWYVWVYHYKTYTIDQFYQEHNTSYTQILTKLKIMKLS